MKFALSIVLAAVGFGSTALAQGIQHPPRQDANTPTGVSYRDGSFTLSDTDLSVGGGLPTGLSVTRSYNSSSRGISDPYLAAAGWTQSLNMYISNQVVPYIPHPELEDYHPPYEFDRCIYNVTGGARSLGFHNATWPPPPSNWGNKGLDAWRQQVGCGYLEGTYVAVGDHNGTLEFVSTPSPGHYRLVGIDGSVMNFTSLMRNALDWTMPDGTRLDFTYGSGGVLKSVFSNRGWAILFESELKSCAVNTALTYVTPTSACPADAQTVTYTYASAVYSTGSKRLTSVTKGGEITTYEYDGADHVNCVKAPGQTACRIQNTYTACPENQYGGSIQPDVRAHDYVTAQTDASGRTYSYTFADNSCPYPPSYTDPDWRPFGAVMTTATETGVVGHATAMALPSKQLESFTDPLGRTTSFVYDTAMLGDYVEHGEVIGITRPESNAESLTEDDRGNVTDRTVKAKPGSGLADIVTHASYPATCANMFTCNKPSSVTDARLGTADFEYDPQHGGVKLEKAPADANGIRAVKRTSYVQRTAWLKNASGGYTASSYPVWLASETRTCRTSATTGGPGTYACAGGATDEVVTAYDYGPNTGAAGNNLLLRGVAVTADGMTLRTCYAYDRDGRKIGETRPLGTAGLSACP